MIGGLLGVSPVTSYSENIGLTIMTGVVNRTVARVAALIMIICGSAFLFVGTIDEAVAKAKKGE